MQNAYYVRRPLPGSENWKLRGADFQSAEGFSPTDERNSPGDSRMSFSRAVPDRRIIRGVWDALLVGLGFDVGGALVAPLQAVELVLVDHARPVQYVSQQQPQN